MKNLLIIGVITFFSAMGSAIEFSLPPANEYIVGKVQTINSEPGDTLGKIGERYDIGYVEMAEANPDFELDNKLSVGTKIMIPSQFILPNAPREGIVINLAELRLYYYPPHQNKVHTFPMGIGREGWETPLGSTYISKKDKDPFWYPTDSVRQDAAAQGYTLPESVPPGPENPLGRYKMRLGASNYLIHSTNRSDGVGRRSSAGCMRMYPNDAEFLFNAVPLKMKVHIINQPYKVAWQGKKLYMEAHMPLQEQQLNDGADLAPMIAEILRIAKQKNYQLDWQQIKLTADATIGIPIRIGTAL